MHRFPGSAPWAWALVLVLSFTTRAAAENHARFTLDDLLRALRTHPALAAADFATAAARSERDATKLWQNPSASIAYTPGVRNSSYDRAGYLSYGLSQFLELSNTPGARKQAAELSVAALRAEREALWVDLSLNVEVALINLVAAERKMTLVGRALELLSQAADVVEKRVAAGGSPRYDQTRIGVTVATAHADLDEALAAHARAWGELHAAVGPGMRQVQGAPDYPLETALALPEPGALLTLLEQKRPDLEALRKRVAAAEAQVGVAKRGVWSGVLLSALGGFGAAPGQIDVGVGLSSALPVVDRGQGSVPAAQQRARQAQSYLESVLLPAALRIAGMREEIARRQQALESYLSRAVTSGDEMLEEAQAGYLAGRFSVLELADAYSAWREARLRAVDLAASARQAEVELGRSVGTSLRAQ